LRKLAYVLILIIVMGTTAWGLITYNQLLEAHSELDPLRRQLATLEVNLEQAEHRLAQTKEELSSTKLELATIESELQLYKDTWGSVVASGVQPPFQGANIVNYETASDPTWAELSDFIREDKTDRRAYVPGVYMCGDFARDVHDNAEQAGIRAAYVTVRLPGDYHALNAFKTTDRGLVFIDCTGLQLSQAGPTNRDKTVDVKLGRNYRPSSLFPESGWNVLWENMGTILDVQIYW
jgi:pyruvate/2-oxoglutarate dehydrogenase complex dihydrolipoamide dehydrogenase (E3) component